MRLKKSVLVAGAAAFLFNFIIPGCVQGPVVEEPPVYIPDHAVPLNEGNFDSAVVREGVVAIIEFYEPICGTCGSMMWVIESLAVSIGDSALVGTVDIDSNPALSTRYGIESIPSYLLFRDGEVVSRRTYGEVDSTALDTLAALVRGFIEGTIDPDTADTGSIDTTGEVTDTIIVNLGVTNFDSLVVRESVYAVVDFYSPICGECQEIAPVFDSIGMHFDDSLLLGKVNVDENDTLMKRYAVESVPTFAFFDGGECITLKTIDPGDGAFDTLAALIRALLDGTLASDTADTADTAATDYLTLNDSTFDTTVLRQGTIAMVFFLYAEGLPCIYMDSVVATLVPFYEGRALIARMHAWDQYSTSAIAQRYGITSVPRYLFFKDSVMVEELSGTFPGYVLADVLNRLLGDTIPGVPVQLDKNNFRSMVHLPERVAMVDFFSPTCGACITMDSVVTNLAERFSGTALIGKVNAQEDDSLDATYFVQWLPSFVFLKSGVEYARLAGVTPEDTLAAYIERGLYGETAKRQAEGLR
ncbi:MAG: hypothetical protein JXA18_09505 [Chitinispirillaceae bacterium]|nr:hypothetical protein [Chitinispirillaceae bacterium]